MNVKNISIIGLGYVGGSFGIALKKSFPDVIITGIDKGSVLVRAKAMGAIDNGCLFNELEVGLKEADVVIIATSVKTAKEIVPRVASLIKKGTIVTDTAITKSEICKFAAEHFDSNTYFIGGHPIIGFKRGGTEHASPYIFTHNTWVLTPLDDEKDSEAVHILKRILTEIGAMVIVINPELHDDLSGALNHILQIIAVAHVNSIFSDLDESVMDVAIALGGERFKRFSEPLLTPSYFWEDIIASNDAFIRKNVDRFIKKLSEINRSITSQKFYDEYTKAQKIIKQIPAVKKGFSTRLSHLYVVIEDKPGSIARLTSLIAENGFDIRDIEVVKVKEGDAVVVRVSFKTQAIASRVGTILMEYGYNYTTHFDYGDFYLY